MKDPRKAVIEAAAKSPCVKRKVGAVITDYADNILATGWNHNPKGHCEDHEGKTLAEVIHAEIAAITFLDMVQIKHASKIYVTHEPCDNCREAIAKADIDEIIVVNEFLKFDKDKLRYDLVPTSAYKGLAEVLTFGAKKYKPNNWRRVDDIARYMGAAERHLQDFKAMLEKGNFSELNDEESGLHVLKHALTDIVFLLELTKTETDALNMYQQSEVYNEYKDQQD